MVNGNNVTQTHLTNIKSDISSILNGGLTDSNIAAAAGIVESKLAFNLTTGHHHDAIDSRAISTGAFRGFIQGAWLNYVAADQVKADSGVLDIGGTLYTRTSYSTTIDTDTAANWVEGASQRGVSKLVYVYAYNDSGTSWDVKYWLQPPLYANTITDDSSNKIYRQSGTVWYRMLGTVWLDATGSGNIVPFYQDGDDMFYDGNREDTDLRFVNAAAAGAYVLQTITQIPTTCKSVTVSAQNNAAGPTGVFLSIDGSTDWCVSPEGSLGGTNSVVTLNSIPCPNQQVYAKSNVNAYSLYVRNYRMGIR